MIRYCFGFAFINSFASFYLKLSGNFAMTGGFTARVKSAQIVFWFWVYVTRSKGYSKLLARRWSIVSEDYFTHSQRLTTTFFAFTQGHNICYCSTNGAQNSNAQFLFSMGMFSLVKLQELNSSFTRCRKKRLDLHC